MSLSVSSSREYINLAFSFSGLEGGDAPPCGVVLYWRFVLSGRAQSLSRVSGMLLDLSVAYEVKFEFGKS